MQDARPPAHITEFIQNVGLSEMPDPVIHQVGRLLLDLVGVGLGGARTRLSSIIRNHAARQFGGPLPMLFDDRTASASGAALAGGMTIDALDGHDGFNIAKGHVGCALMPSVLALMAEAGIDDGHAASEALIIGYELGARLGPILHDTAPDYHTSGAWMATAVAGVGARILGLDGDQTAHAMGIAEYHGPRSQMMRCIDHPTMVKDGSGWGAMAGVSAALLARDGFTGAPALTAGGHPLWEDLGRRWLILEQYIKPYPVCRWAQPPVEAVLALRDTHALTADQVVRIEIETFHECARLAMSRPANTEQAQYSTAYPCAVALVRGTISAADISDESLTDPEIRRLGATLIMSEADEANRVFPARRIARARLRLIDGRMVEGGWHEARWEPGDPPSDADLLEKFHALADPLVNDASELALACLTLPVTGDLGRLTRRLHRSIRPPG
ncbi:MAG: MmgE/PrpD family protein [Pseudomonadota bacterium]